jgi:hypothetical protein
MNTTIEELQDLTFIHLQDAVFCANCELIANQTFDESCPACGSKALMSVSRLLGGTVIPASGSEESGSRRAPGRMLAGEEHSLADFFHRSSLLFRHSSRN